MPKAGRGRGGSGHKGQRRHFTNPDQLVQSQEKKERERQWRQQRGELSSEDSDAEGKESSEEEEEESGSGSEEEKSAKAKGVEHLIEVENPNRIIKKEKKPDDVEVEAAPNTQLSRKEKEEIEKQRAKVHYQKMHAAGKTNEAKADLARLAIIKKQREDAAKRREEEIKAKQEAELAKAAQTKKALGRNT